MKSKVVVFLGSWLVIGPAHSADLRLPSSGVATLFASSSFDLAFSVGAMNARAGETVYATKGDDTGLPPGARLSQLNWNTQAAGIAGLTLGWNALPSTRIEASLHLSFTRDDSKMTNTDWLSPEAFPNWTDRALHPDTRSGQTYIADIKIARQVLVWDDVSAHALAGFRRTQLAWKAYGGTFVYTEADADDCSSYGSTPSSFSAGSDFRNCTGAFDPVAQITYRQTYNTPYLGVRGAYASGSWNVNVDVVGTLFGWSSDRDLHVGETLFKATVRQQKMLGATLKGSYKLNPVFSLFAEADGQWFFNRKGGLKAWDVTSGEYSNFGQGSSGISLQTMRLSAGLKATY